MIRPRVRADQCVVWWSTENMVIYASEASLAAYPVLRTDSEVSEIEWVHVNMLRSASVRNLLCHLRSALVDALTRRFSHNRELSSDRSRADKPKHPNE